MYELTSCIAAIATAPGQGGIGIIRLSGPGVMAVLPKVFKARYLGANSGPCPQHSLPGSIPIPPGQGSPALKPWVLHRGWALDEQGRELDDALAVFMPGPRTFTGEDCAEIHCHGGRVLLETALLAVIKAGARHAGPGEFSYRAFINGRMDLSQAEAVAELISASSRQGIRLAKAKLDGALGQKINALKDKLHLLQAQLCLLLDFSMELSGAETDNLEADELKRGFQEVLRELRSLSKAYQRARAWREGALVVLAGPVNAGKSSLMNTILGRKRSLVGPAPGTTRDYIEENTDLEGLPVRLVDTAGLRETSDSVEAEGVDLSRELAAQADYIILLRDCSVPGTAEEAQLLDTYPNNSLLVLNKSDLLPPLLSPLLSQDKKPLGQNEYGMPGHAPSEKTGPAPLCISAKSGQGVDELLQILRRNLLARFGTPAQKEEAGLSGGLPRHAEDNAFQSDADNGVNGDDGNGGRNAWDSDVAPNLRQSRLIEAAEDEIENLLQDLDDAMPAELLSVRLDMAVSHLRDIVGTSGLDDVMHSIFSKFCIGK